MKVSKYQVRMDIEGTNQSLSHSTKRRLSGAPSDTVNVISGDRNFVPTGGARNSPHLTGEAADFHVVGKNDTQVDQSLKDSTSPVNTGFRLIQHGPDTITEGAHVPGAPPKPPLLGWDSLNGRVALSTISRGTQGE